MKIKIPNLMLTIASKKRWKYFRLNNGTILDYSDNGFIHIAYSPESEFHFLAFDSNLKKFHEDEGFGSGDVGDSEWWAWFDWENMEK